MKKIAIENAPKEMRKQFNHFTVCVYMCVHAHVCMCMSEDDTVLNKIFLKNYKPYRK